MPAVTESAENKVSGVNIRTIEPLLSPVALMKLYPADEAMTQTVIAARERIQNILSKKSSRFLVICGPCSIHDEKAALEYAAKLRELQLAYQDRLEIVMRVYFEKPRTTIGWKGLITDPQIDGQDDVQEGLKTARRLLQEIVAMGIPTATEFLDPIVPQYIADLVSWAAIGARTTESQTHRQMASGLSMPVGYKNSTDGNVQIALDAMQSARSPHSFLGIDETGRTAVVRTNGNPWGHVILRGGNNMTNYEPEHIARAEEKLKAAGIEPAIVVDCSHANSEKKFERQENVWRSIIAQRQAGNTSLIGMMLESNLHEGNQKLPEKLDAEVKANLKYGVSITDACVNFATTETLLKFAYESLL